MNKILFLLASLLYTFSLRAQPAPAPPTDPKDLAASKALFESWKEPITPGRVVGNVYYVGAKGVSSFLVTTPAGHFLLDTGFDDTVPLIQHNAEALGVRWQDVKFILSSHAHNDHVGGHARMKKLTGATIVASAPEAHLLSTGGDDDFSPFPKELMLYTPVKADRVSKDGAQIRLGNVTLTAHLTPGHTKGATTWTMRAEERGVWYDVVFFSSTSIVSGTKLVNNDQYRGIADDYRQTFRKLKSFKCDIFLAPHGNQFNLEPKLDKMRAWNGTGDHPFVDRERWKRLLVDAERAFLLQLTAERKTE